MRHISNQTLASTNLDSQGERLSKDFLERFQDQAGNTRFPIHQHHDMTKPVAGYIENIRLIPDDLHPGEWRLIGDVFYEEDKVEDVLGGFSISGMEMLRRVDVPSALVYLPFPHYNDEELVRALAADPELNIGKWIKKGAEPIGWVLLGSALTFAATPIWDDVYKRKIAPRIDALLTKYLSTFQRKGLTPELAQIIQFQGKDVEVRLIPTKGNEAECLRSEVVYRGLVKVVAFLTSDLKAGEVGVKRIVVFYNDAIGAFSIHRIEYADGAVVHMA
jgi:hypothetical protein